jgi:hypothetical protein
MGRTAVPLTQFISEEGLEDELVLPLGKGDWTNLEGPVSAACTAKCIDIDMHAYAAAARLLVLRARVSFSHAVVSTCSS